MSDRTDAVNWCFTLNNYKESEYELLKDLDVAYLIIGKEVGEQGTPHLQGYIQFHKKKRITALKKINQRIHWEKIKGTPEDNIKYCSKEDKNPFIKGELKATCGVAAKNSYKAAILAASTWDQVLDIPGIERIMNYAREVWAGRPIPTMAEPSFRPIQKYILDKLNEEPDDRTIVYVYDRKGSVGKTFLGKYLYANKGAFYCSPSKSADIFIAYNNQRIFVYDIPRCTDDQFINWGALEKIKDGILFSGKYNSTTKYRPFNCHVIVFSNSPPPEDKFSSDRLSIIDVEQWLKDEHFMTTIIENAKNPETPLPMAAATVKVCAVIGGSGGETLKPETPLRPAHTFEERNIVDNKTVQRTGKIIVKL